jgi:hypothetical protein
LFLDCHERDDCAVVFNGVLKTRAMIGFFRHRNLVIAVLSNRMRTTPAAQRGRT